MALRKLILKIILLGTLLSNAAAADAQYNKDYFYWASRRCLMNREYQEAIRVLNTLLRADPDAAEGYFLRGVAKFNLDDLLGADTDFSAAIVKNPVFTTAYIYRALTRTRMGNYDDALQDFREAIDLRPDLPDAYYSRGYTRLQNKQYKEAIEDFDKFIFQENKVADAYIGRGAAYLYLKDTVRALENFDQAIRTNRENPNGYYQRGTLLLQKRGVCPSRSRLRHVDPLRLDFPAALFQPGGGLFQHQPPDAGPRGFRPGTPTGLDQLVHLFQPGDSPHPDRRLQPRTRRLRPRGALLSRQCPGLLPACHAQNPLGRPRRRRARLHPAIELYPDFANAYLNRSALRYALHNPKAAKRDEEIAQRKIAEYKSHLKDSTYSIYADTTQRMDKLLAFDNQFTNNYFDRISEQPSLGRSNMRLLPLFRFTLMQPDTSRIEASNRYTLQRVKDFEKKLDNPYLVLSNRPTNIDADSLAMLDSRYAEILCQNPRDWLLQVQYAISQSLIRQFTNSVGAYSSAIADNAANPFLYFNRAVTRAEMIDFISGLDNPYQRISIDSDPANKLTNTHTRTYNYDEAIADLDKTLRLFPNFAEAYYNRGTLLALSGKLPEAFEDFSRAIELNPLFAEAFYNRGMTQIYMKDTRKGCLDLSKAGEPGHYLGLRNPQTLHGGAYRSF